MIASQLKNFIAMATRVGEYSPDHYQNTVDSRWVRSELILRNKVAQNDPIFISTFSSAMIGRIPAPQEIIMIHPENQ